MDSKGLALLQEFASRKEQVLNLEVRQFVLVLALEALFLVVFILNGERVRKSKELALGSALVYFILFFELLAINGKMGVISMYLRQMEAYMATLGYAGVVWESKALDMLVFRPGNAFTLPAVFAILCLMLQTYVVVYHQVRHFANSPRTQYFVTALIGIPLLLLVAKTLSVDFGQRLPQIFD